MHIAIRNNNGINMNESNYNMKPQDIVILFKILSWQGEDWKQAVLSSQLGISQSEISESIRRSKYSGLISSLDMSVNRIALIEFVIYGLKYVFPQKPGPILRGVPTAHSAPFLQGNFFSDINFVWPSARGTSQGQAIIPLYKTVPKAIESDEDLYQYLAIADVVRVGKVREKEMAIKLLKQKIQHA